MILDPMLPDGDSIGLFRASERPIRVAVTTGSIDRTRIESVRLLNPDVLLIEPIILEELMRGLGIGRRG
jgi:hypothetical protein